MNSAAGTDCRADPSDRVSSEDPRPADGRGFATRLEIRPPEPFPYTEIRDWIALLEQRVLGDGAFRLYCVSRSLARGNPRQATPRPTSVDVSYGRYAAILGHPVEAIARFAEELFTTGLWEQAGDEKQSPTDVPDGTARIIRVHDHPRGPGDYEGPTTAWDLLATAAHPSEDTTRSIDSDTAGSPDQDALDDTAVPGRARPSAAARELVADELAMFTAAAVDLVATLDHKAMTTPGLQPLSAQDRAGLARRIDARLAEGWSLGRIRAVLTGGSLVGVKLPGRLWCGRLDDMPPATRLTSVPRDSEANSPVPHPRRSGAQARAETDRRGRGLRTNDCSTLPDPNVGRTRYEVPDGRAARMTVRWTDDRRVPPWCGRCSEHSRCLRPIPPGALLRPCPECHPEPDAFPPGEPQQPSDAPARVTADTD